MITIKLPDEVKRIRTAGHGSVVVVLDEFDKLVRGTDEDRHTYWASILVMVLTLFESCAICLPPHDDNRPQEPFPRLA
jgi:hypothetical protein